MAPSLEEAPSPPVLKKHTTITVFVDEVLPDIIVVNFEFGSQIFKGVLLDSTKRNLPCGVPNLNPVFTKKPEEDPLYAQNQRFAYLDPNAPKRKKVQLGAKFKNSKMTVRLRPRQVLCSKCKGICNENSENVSRKRKSEKGHSPPPPPSRRSSNAPITRSVNNYLNSNSSNNKLNNKNGSNRRKLRSSENIEESSNELISKASSKNMASSEENSGGEQPWLSSEETANSKKPVLGVFINMDETPIDQPMLPKHSTEHSDPLGSDPSPPEPPKLTPTQSLRAARRTVRRKRNNDSTESPWSEENSNQTSSTTADAPSLLSGGGSTSTSSNLTSSIPSSGSSSSVTGNVTTKTIKISYGPQGEGTVLKIPAQIDPIPEVDRDESNSFNPPTLSVSDQKAARRALKRARKEARRKIIMGGSPMYFGGASPRYGIGGSSPRYTVGSASPRQGLGNNSPRYIMPSFDLTLPRRRKHKVKHKKKHKEDRDRNRHKEEGEVSSSTQYDTKEQCITQKLSINLKRLNDGYSADVAYSSNHTYTAIFEDSSSSGSEDHGVEHQIPNFPQANSPLISRLDSIKLTSAMGADGVRLLAGDIIWAKLPGIPWWPGKILTIYSCQTSGSSSPVPPQAHVAWFGATASSIVQCDQMRLYLDNFRELYNKKKKGAYREAIKQANFEAQDNGENRVRQPLGNSPSHNIIQVVPPALASPREIDVAS